MIDILWVINQSAFVLEWYCITHCQTLNSPNWDEANFEAFKYCEIHTYETVASEKETDLHEQGACIEQLMCRDTSVTHCQQNSGMVSGISKKNWGSSKRGPPANESWGTWGTWSRTGGIPDEQSEYQHSSESVIGTCAASHACDPGMQSRKRYPGKYIQFCMQWYQYLGNPSKNGKTKNWIRGIRSRISDAVTTSSTAGNENRNIYSPVAK